jgi:hypothetical protein
LLTLLSLAPLAGAAQEPVPAPQSPQPATLSPPPLRVGLALVIGNSRYAEAELPSVVTDRTTMAKALHSLGFTVREVEDLQRPRDFQEELQTFLKTEDAAPEDILLVYYSGHGMQADGKAYLIGTGIKASSDMSAGLREYSEDVDDLIHVMEQAAPSARVLIVDACRNNAFAQTTRKAGTAFQRNIEDTYILFADEPGKTVPARSQASVQSPFTAGLLFAFENSDDGIEKRFEIAREKTIALNPDQHPQLLKSDLSPERSRPFLDHGGRAAPALLAGQMLNDAKELYRIGAWDDFHDKIHAARILSSDSSLSARLDHELAFCELVLAARAAEVAASGPQSWADAAASWQKAVDIFPARVWVLERAALDWLLADRLEDAALMLGRLRRYQGDPIGNRAAQMLVNLARLYPRIEPAIKALSAGEPIATGPEFEEFIISR